MPRVKKTLRNVAQTIDDLHRMADYFNQLRLLTFAMTGLGMLGGLCFLLFRVSHCIHSQP